jgi:hypothetical protein
MRARDPGFGGSAVAALASVALLVVLLGSTGGFLMGPDGPGEPCVGCSGCDSGECGDGDEHPLTAHHHCCTTCCFSHAPIVLCTALPVPAPAIVRPMAPSPFIAVTARAPVTPYRPPRV